MAVHWPCYSNLYATRRPKPSHILRKHRCFFAGLRAAAEARIMIPKNAHPILWILTRRFVGQHRSGTSHRRQESYWFGGYYSWIRHGSKGGLVCYFEELGTREPLTLWTDEDLFAAITWSSTVHLRYVYCVSLGAMDRSNWYKQVNVIRMWMCKASHLSRSKTLTCSPGIRMSTSTSLFLLLPKAEHVASLRRVIKLKCVSEHDVETVKRGSAPLSQDQIRSHLVYTT